MRTFLTCYLALGSFRFLFLGCKNLALSLLSLDFSFDAIAPVLLLWSFVTLSWYYAWVNSSDPSFFLLSVHDPECCEPGFCGGTASPPRKINKKEGRSVRYKKCRAVRSCNWCMEVRYVVFLPESVIGISEHLDTALQHNIKNFNIRKLSINLMLSMPTVILKYLNLLHIVIDDSDQNIGSKTRVCCWVRFETSLRYVRFRSRDLQSFLQIPQMYKHCTYALEVPSFSINYLWIGLLEILDLLGSHYSDLPGA